MLFIVTGASSGIGFAAARALAIQHHNVIAVARNADKLETLKSGHGDCIQILPADLSTESGRATVIEHAKHIGHIDGIVHAAGSLISPAGYQSLKADEMAADLTIHVSVPILLNSALEDELAGGRIVYIDSYSASSLRVGWSGYSIIKAAAQMAARSAATEIPKSAVIRIFPGAVRTPLVETMLTSQQSSPTFDLFKALESEGSISEPDIIGEFIANVMINATDQQLKEREIWDFNNPHDRHF